ncbi:MAG: hypothetical protein K6F63_02580 [Lachnospiraceae bacterium]|nr:hypothetical protein [Lachnospiraceae bacterium]
MANISSLTNSNLYKALYNGNSGKSGSAAALNSFLESMNGNSSKKTNQANTTGSSDIFSALGSNAFSDLTMIKKGSYKRLLSAYYEKYGNNGSSSATDAVTSEISNLKTVSDDASNLKDSVSKLRKIDFSKEENADSSLAAAKGFAESYNSLIESSVNVNRQSVLKDTLSLVNYMKKNSGMLNELGMKLGTDNKITFDEDKWKNAYSTSKSSMFNGVGSFGYQASYKIGKINSSAAAGTGKATPASNYTSTGNYRANDYISQLFNTES